MVSDNKKVVLDHITMPCRGFCETTVNKHTQQGLLRAWLPVIAQQTAETTTLSMALHTDGYLNDCKVKVSHDSGANVSLIGSASIINVHVLEPVEIHLSSANRNICT